MRLYAALGLDFRKPRCYNKYGNRVDDERVGRPALLFAFGEVPWGCPGNRRQHAGFVQKKGGVCVSPETKKKGGVAERVREMAEPLARELGLSIWDVQFLKEGADWFLRIFIDKEDGVGIDDCVDMTHAIGPWRMAAGCCRGFCFGQRKTGNLKCSWTRKPAVPCKRRNVRPSICWRTTFQNKSAGTQNSPGVPEPAWPAAGRQAQFSGRESAFAKRVKEGANRKNG